MNLDVKFSNRNEKKINYFLDKIHLSYGEEILDVGTGDGILIPFIMEKCGDCKIDAVDISDVMLEFAKSKYGNLPQVVFKKINVENNKITKKYNKIILYSVFQYIQRKVETIYNLVNENLKIDGKLIIAYPNSRKYLNNLHNSKRKYLNEDRLIDVNLQKNLFKLAGLDVVEAFENDDMYYLIIKRVQS
ncbi:SAM-dependent methyltransferase [Clostridium septicum]|uniref:Class I SAM-dependent methyltransferase n=1 Tax=Clostridium septicum TaxID=1504 RepID=A0A9N7JK15_CLOSE|nr:class I SAM-dependent methyltransferase [Clostridium septicum]AYE33399.1 hypothetical protein CP523_02445 [Clostridium septicum]MDU1313992.1 class I SAM-dependent methyltransferase [Clostridium septicum]QAS61573.1 class I SAM-dependent methyltransferase [Clostridium septicum]UEC21991.1 class I SAM-dependent methyltransferase [Clostridium septicum]USR99977.1 class I SAM-dependent methyltransferase [Clostridium septicum]